MVRSRCSTRAIVRRWDLSFERAGDDPASRGPCIQREEGAARHKSLGRPIADFPVVQLPAAAERDGPCADAPEGQGDPRQNGSDRTASTQANRTVCPLSSTPPSCLRPANAAMRIGAMIEGGNPKRRAKAAHAWRETRPTHRARHAGSPRRSNFRAIRRPGSALDKETLSWSHQAKKTAAHSGRRQAPIDWLKESEA